MWYARPFQRIQNNVDTSFLRPADGDKARQAGLCPFSQELAARWFHHVPVLHLRPPLRQHGERTGAHKARKIISAKVRSCWGAVHNRQAVRVHWAVLWSETSSAKCPRATAWIVLTRFLPHSVFGVMVVHRWFYGAWFCCLALLQRLLILGFLVPAKRWLRRCSVVANKESGNFAGFFVLETTIFWFLIVCVSCWHSAVCAYCGVNLYAKIRILKQITTAFVIVS